MGVFIICRGRQARETARSLETRFAAIGLAFDTVKDGEGERILFERAGNKENSVWVTFPDGGFLLQTGMFSYNGRYGDRARKDYFDDFDPQAPQVRGTSGHFCLVIGKAGATAVVSMLELFGYYLQRGLIDVGFLGAAQIDRFGNINTTVIGAQYTDPKVRLPGAGGASEIAASCKEVIVVVRQSPRSFVERLDFVTSVGYGDGPGYRERLGLTGAGPRKIITDLGILEPDPRTCELTLTGVFPGVEVADVKAKTGWGLAVSESVDILTPPSQRELSALRELQAPVPASEGAAR